MAKKKRKSSSAKKRKRRPQVSNIQSKRKSGQTVSKSVKVSRKLFRFLISLLTVIGFLFIVWPRISLSPGTSLDLHNPFQTPFIIKNDGYLPLFNIKYSLIAEKMELLDGNTFTNSGGNTGNIVEKLSPNKSSALFINRIFSMPPDIVKSARIFIHVTYKLYLIPFTFSERIKFKTEIDTDGEYIWFEFYE